MPLVLADDPTLTPSPTPTATEIVSAPPASLLPAYLLPTTIDRAVPAELTPSLARAKLDRPIPYLDRCHTQQNLTASASACVYGDKSAKTTIVLFGDSHALSWFPAMELLAKAKHWRLLSLTMSSCWPADIPAWNSTTQKLMTNCAVWRKNTLKQIVQIHPHLIFVSGTRGFSTIDGKGKVLSSDQRASVWEAGMRRTIDILKTASSGVISISDIPVSMYDPPACLAGHRSSILACSTPLTRAISLAWLSLESHIAAEENIEWVDPTTWICSSDPCSPIVGNNLIYIDAGHLSATFALTLEPPLWKEISKQ
jgi:hypothetical protein